MSDIKSFCYYSFILNNLNIEKIRIIIYLYQEYQILEVLYKQLTTIIKTQWFYAMKKNVLKKITP